MKLTRLIGLVSMFAACALAGGSASNLGEAPEPATMLMLGTGLGVVGLAAWRRNRRK